MNDTLKNVYKVCICR